MKDLKIVFVHGYTASANQNWYPKISDELTKLGVDFVIPNLPGGEHPHALEWLDILDKAISKINQPIVLVGHSLGTRTILLYLEKYKPKVQAVFLISAFANRLENAHKFDGDGYPDFFEHLINIEDIKKTTGKFVVMHSKDDPLDYEQGVEIANQLKAKLISFENRGHFANSNNAPIILKSLREELDI